MNKKRESTKQLKKKKIFYFIIEYKKASDVSARAHEIGR
jgi:hypothetical protein